MKNFKTIHFGLALSFLSACTNLPVKESERKGFFDVEASGGLLKGGAINAKTWEKSLGSEIAGVKIQSKDFDLPIADNRAVEYWVKYYSTRGKRTFQLYMDRYAQMAPMMRPRLKAAGLPEDLVFAAMIESGFSTRARSHAGAVGPWQFMPRTGKQYGLKIDWWVDERKDPYKSTEAAIRYFRKLYNDFDSWELAIAAYNAGEGKIFRAIKRHRTKNFWKLTKTRSIRNETKDHIPKVMAAAILTKNAAAFGFRAPTWDNSLEHTTLLNLTHAEDLKSIAKVANIRTKLLRQINPELKRWCTPPVRAYKLRLPNLEAKNAVLTAIAEEKLSGYKGFRRYLVMPGDTLSQIARRHHVSMRPILSLNNLRSARFIRPGQALVLPLRAGGKIRKTASLTKQTKTPKGHNSLIYVVKKGDTLYGISRRYHISVRQLKRWNSIYHHKRLRPGRQLRLYVKNDRKI